MGVLRGMSDYGMSYARMIKAVYFVIQAANALTCWIGRTTSMHRLVSQKVLRLAQRRCGQPTEQVSEHSTQRLIRI
jgi:hypothetical protein